MRNEEWIDKRKIATKFNFKSYDKVFNFVVWFGTTYGIEGCLMKQYTQ